MKPTAAPSRVQVSLVQTWADVDPASNRRRTAALVHRAADEGAQIVCLQELFTSQYFCHDEKIDSFDLAEPIQGPSLEMFAPIARDRQIVIILPFFEKRSAGIYHNSAIILDADGSTAGMYRKMHIPHDPHFYEKYFFTREISASRQSTLATAGSASSSVGINGSPKGPGSPPCKVLRSSFTPPPSAG